MFNEVSKTTRALFLISVFAVVLDVARVGLSQKTNFAFLIWNLVLAWVPYILATYLKNGDSWKKFSAIFVPWILFFPNAAYLITDILHVDNRPPIPLWYDSLIFFIFAWIGTILGALSMHKVYKYLEYNLKKIYAYLFVFGISALTGFGIYLGRFERWNSWDALTNPIDLIQNIFWIGRDLPRTYEPLLFTLVFATTVLFTFYLVKEIQEDRG